MEKIIELEYSVDTDQPCRFLSNKKDNILEKLKEEFEHKCFNGRLIIEILSISRTSMARSQLANNSGKATINILFNARTLAFPPKYIIPEAKIHLSNGQVLASSDTIYVSILKNPNNKILVNEQKAPIILDNTIKYNTGNTQVNAIGHLLMPLNTVTVYNINGFLTNKQYEQLISLLESIEEQDKKPFDKNISSYLASYKNTESKGTDVIELIKKSKSNNVDVTGYWYRNLKNKPESTLYIKDTKYNNDSYIEVSPYEGFKEMLWEIFNMRNAMIGISNYSSEDLSKSNNIWKLMNKNKLE